VPAVMLRGGTKSMVPFPESKLIGEVGWIYERPTVVLLDEALTRERAGCR
jgi:hypothetical protein